jgi:hypothetical protein
MWRLVRNIINLINKQHNAHVINKQHNAHVIDWEDYIVRVLDENTKELNTSTEMFQDGKISEKEYLDKLRKSTALYVHVRKTYNV